MFCTEAAPDRAAMAREGLVQVPPLTVLNTGAWYWPMYNDNLNARSRTNALVASSAPLPM